MIKTTNKHFEIFKREAEAYAKLIRLDDWDIYYIHGLNIENELEGGVFATAIWLVEQKSGTLRLAKTWDDEITPLDGKSLKKVARHEVLHLLYAPIQELADKRFDVSSEAVTEAIHTLIHKQQQRERI